jgi:hypothetical protein
LGIPVKSQATHYREDYPFNNSALDLLIANLKDGIKSYIENNIYQKVIIVAFEIT